MILHNALPFGFTIAGLIMVSNFNSPLSFYLGIMLMLVGCLIWMRRQDNRQIKSEVPENTLS